MRARIGLCGSVAAMAMVLWMAPHVWRGSEPPQSPAHAAKPEADQPIQALAFRQFRSVGGPFGVLPENAFMRAKQHRDQMMRRGPLNAGLSPMSWSWLGPGNVGGRLRPIVFKPGDPNTIYVGSQSGGVWKTTNGGTNWLPLDDFMPAMAVGSMAIDWANPDTLYAGTGEGFAEWPDGTSNTAFVRGAGIFKTTDGGVTWNQLASTSGSDFHFVNRIAVSPANSQILLAATSTGLFRSTNGGSSWTKTGNGFYYDVRFHPTDGTRALAGLHDDGVAYSTNGGQTWSSASGIAGHRTELAYYKANPQIVYAAVAEADRIKIYRSTNGGQSFTLRTTGSGISTYSAYNVALWVDPTNSDRLIYGGVYLYRSTNGGSSQSQVFTNIHADMHGIYEHPGYNGTSNRTAYVACDGGIYRINDTTGSSTTNLNNNMGVTQFYGATVNPSSGVVLGGTQDNYTLRYTGNPQGWTQTFGGDGGHTATDLTNSNYWYGEIQWGQVFRSTNGGASASYIYSGISDAGGDQTNFITYLALDPNNQSRLLVGCRRLWRTNNSRAGTVSWSVIKDSIGNRAEPPNAHFLGNSPYNISTFAIAEGNSDLIWVGHNNGNLYKTTNGTAGTPTWIRIDLDGLGLPDRWISKIIIDPTNHSRVYVAFMGWNSDNLWMTENGGTSWTPVTGSGTFALPAVPVSALALSRTDPGFLYVGTELGLFTSVDNGANWMPEPAGPALVPIEELHWQDDVTLLAVTHGRGIYRASVNTAQDPIVPYAYFVRFGQPMGGKLPWLYLSDDRKVGAAVSFATDEVLPVGIEFRGHVPYNSLSELRFTMEASVSRQGQGQAVQLYNFALSRWVTLHSGNATVTDSTRQVAVSSNPMDYVNGTTREVWARAVWYDVATDDLTVWSAAVDHCYWTAVR